MVCTRSAGVVVDRLLRLLDFTEDDGVLLFLRQIRALIDLLALERGEQQTQRVLAFLVFVLHGLHHGGANGINLAHANLSFEKTGSDFLRPR